MRAHVLSDSALTVGCLIAMFAIWPWLQLASLFFACVAIGLVVALHRKSVLQRGPEGREGVVNN